jgi:hypothetical protein
VIRHGFTSARLFAFASPSCGAKWQLTKAIFKSPITRLIPVILGKLNFLKKRSTNSAFVAVFDSFEKFAGRDFAHFDLCRRKSGTFPFLKHNQKYANHVDTGYLELVGVCKRVWELMYLFVIGGHGLS